MKKLILLAGALLCACLVQAKITLPALLGDGMVLQQQSEVTLWGRTTGTYVKVTASWESTAHKTQPDKDGNWSVRIHTPEAGGPYNILIVDDKDGVFLQDVLIGEVWICSGQSNMEMPLGGWDHQRVAGAYETIRDAASTPLIRMFTVARNNADTPQEDCSGSWQKSTRETLRGFSAAAYHFGKTLSQFLPGVPVGLIASDWGGTPIEAWLSVQALEHTPGIDVAFSKTLYWEEVHTGQLFNGMIYPLRRFAARGFIWYQGEANLDRPSDYPLITVSMVNEWRTLWGNPDMPYYLVQIAPYSYGDPDGCKLPRLVENQYRIPSLLPHSAVAATTDIGHRDCIHPPYKKEVGERLAWLALANDYDVEGLPLTPTYQSWAPEGAVARVRFNGVSKIGDCWRIHGPQEQLVPGGFEVAGEDRVWHPASAQIEWGTNDILVSSPDVPAPVAVRYAWHNWPAGANVVTDNGLPLPPFSSVEW